MFIYRVSSPHTPRVYIGMTIRTLKRRWSEHCCAARLGAKTPLYNAMRAFGLDSFAIEQIDTAENVAALRKKELYYIEKYESHARQNGFNLTDHGANFGRLNEITGEAHYRAKLNDDAVVFIRDPKHAALSNKALLELVKVAHGIVISNDCLRDARRGDSWTHLNEMATPYKRQQGSGKAPITAERRASATATLNAFRTQAHQKLREKVTGKRASHAKIPEAAVEAIYFSSKSLSKTAQEYGVSKKMVLLIKQAKAHRYLTERLQNA